MKKFISILACLSAIAVCGFMFMFSLAMVSCATQLNENEGFIESVANAIGTVFLPIFLVAMLISLAAAIVAGACMITSTKRTKLNLVLLILLVLVNALAFMSGAYEYAFCCLIPLVLQILALIIPRKKEKPVVNQPQIDRANPSPIVIQMTGTAKEESTSSQSLEEKIAELKRLKFNGTIDEEQYNTAVDSLLKKL